MPAWAVQLRGLDMTQHPGLWQNGKRSLLKTRSHLFLTGHLEPHSAFCHWLCKFRVTPQKSRAAKIRLQPLTRVCFSPLSFRTDGSCHSYSYVGCLEKHFYQHWQAVLRVLATFLRCRHITHNEPGFQKGVLENLASSSSEGLSGTLKPDDRALGNGYLWSF